MAGEGITYFWQPDLNGRLRIAQKERLAEYASRRRRKRPVGQHHALGAQVTPQPPLGDHLARHVTGHPADHPDRYNPHK
jgi:hypothetical protein